MATPFINLSLPIVSETLGPSWANLLNAAFETVDEHDHSSGKGKKIPTSGLNINADLSVGSYRLTSVKSTGFTSQTATLTGASNVNSLYVTNGNLYFTNNSGVAVQLTAGGSIISTPSSLTTIEYQAVTSDLSIGASDTFAYLAIDTSLARTITLPAAGAVSQGRIYIIKDISGSALDNPITVDVTGSDTVDGETSQELNSNFGSWMIVGDGSSAWYIS